MKRTYVNNLFVLLLLAVNLMGTVRYIFRWGEPATSPTYSEVPSAYFLFWDIVIGLMVILVACKTRKLSINYVSIYLLTLIFSLLCLFQVESLYVRGAARNLILYGFFFLFLYSNESWIKISHINRAIEFLSVFGLVFLFYQLYQYHFSGVLPTHSHENQLIRYGSFYDDSLVLGVLLPMFAGYFFNKYQNIFSSLLIAVITCLVAILTGSMTAIGVVFLYVAWNFRKRYVLLSAFLCSALFLSIYFIDQINYLWFFKGDSIDSHIEGWNKLKDLGLLTLSGFYPLDAFAESGFLLLLYNFGAPILIIVVALHVATLLACRVILVRSASSREMQAFAGAAEGLNISVLLASINLPVIIVSPVYLFVAILSAIVIKESVNMTYRTSPYHQSLGKGRLVS